MNFIRRNIWEWERSKSLIFLGMLLSIIHLVNFYFWRTSSPYLSGMDARPLLCWDFFSSCTEFYFLPPQFNTALLTVYALLAALAALFFFSRRFLTFGWIFLALAFLIKTVFYIQDASLQLNFHTLLLLIEFCFLFVPSKLLAVRSFVFIGYLLDGIGKISPEFLSGAGWQGSLEIPLKGLEWIAVFSIVIEVLMPFLLISRLRIRFIYGFIALFVYHLAQFYLTRGFEHFGFATLLLFFVLEHFEYSRLERESLYRSYEHPEPSKVYWAFVMTVFLVAQVPVPGNLPLQALRVERPKKYRECQFVTFLHFSNRVEQVDLLEDTQLPPELMCQTRIAFNRVKNICEMNKRNSEFKNVTSFLLTRRLAEANFSEAFASDRFCDSTYTMEDTRGGR